MIGAFFREIDRADELGSGMRNLMKYGKTYGGADPQLIERECFSHDHQCAGIQRETRRRRLLTSEQKLIAVGNTPIRLKLL